MSSLTPAQAAAQISALINSRSRSPLASELEAIIARVSGDTGPLEPMRPTIDQSGRKRLALHVFSVSRAISAGGPGAIGGPRAEQAMLLEVGLRVRAGHHPPRCHEYVS
jgi:hypothetical protein